MISDSALDCLFRQARSHNGWLPQRVSEAQLRQIYELVKWGPTSANCSPMRVLFVQTDEGRERLRPLLSPGNVEKTMTAPVTAIIGFDTEFHRELPRLFPHNPSIQDSFQGPGRKPMRRSPPFAMRACRLVTSSWPRGRSGSTVGRCRASMPRHSTRPSGPERR